MVHPSDYQHESPRLLIVHDDPDVVQSVLSALGRSCCDELPTQELEHRDSMIVCGCSSDQGTRSEERGTRNEESSSLGTRSSALDPRHSVLDDFVPCVTVLPTLGQLHKFDLSTCDIVLCASALYDGSGIDALAYVRGIRHDLPVIISGDPFDTPLAVEAIRAGAADFLATPGDDLRMLPLTIEKCLAHQRIKQENEHLQSDLSRSLSETAVKNRQLQALIHQLEIMARTDDLTGLCNRRWLNMMLERAWFESLRYGHPLAFMMLDLDGFKVVNDVLGHQKGDEMLRMTGRVLDAYCRQADFPTRYGGDEFCILLPNTRVDEAVEVTAHIQKAYRVELYNFLPDGIEIGMSIGLAHVGLSEPVSAEQLITHADEALYAAKAAGPNSTMVRGKDCTMPVDQLQLTHAPESPGMSQRPFRNAG